MNKWLEYTVNVKLMYNGGNYLIQCELKYLKKLVIGLVPV